MAKPTFYEGQTATNHSTGEKLVYRGGKWFPLSPTGGGGAAPVSSGTEQDRKALQSLRDDASTGLSTAQAAERFIGLNEDTGTGGLRAMPLAPWGNTTWGDVVKSGDPNWGEMKSISASVAPSMRPPGSGATSDKDMAIYMSSFPSVKTLGPANQKIAKRLQDESDQKAARSAFMDEWFARRGNLLGAEQQFAQFWSRRKAGDPVANNINADPVRRANRAIANGPVKAGGFKVLGVE